MEIVNGNFIKYDLICISNNSHHKDILEKLSIVKTYNWGSEKYKIFKENVLDIGLKLWIL